MLTDQSTTDIDRMIMAVFLSLSKNLAAKNDPTGIEIKMGENMAIPNNP